MSSKKVSKNVKVVEDVQPVSGLDQSNNSVKTTRKHFLNLIREHNKNNTQSKIKGYSSKTKTELQELTKDLKHQV